MDIQVDWKGHKSTIPHPSIPAFRLLCEQYGVSAKWDVKDKKLLLEKEDLKGKKVCLISKSTSDTLEMQILRSVEHFLSETGMEILIYSNPSIIPTHGDVSLQCSIQHSKRVQKPESTLITAVKPYPRIFVESLQKDLRSMDIKNKVHRLASKRVSSPFIHIELTLPETGPNSEQEFIEQISISLASGILRYFQEMQPMTLLASLSPEIRQTFMDIIPTLQTESVSTDPSFDMYQEKMLTQKQDVEPANQEEVKVEPVSIKEAKAEIFFDYTLVVPDEKEDDGWLVIGNLNIKNTGTEPLYNPTVLLQVEPPNAINIGGQILPPNVVDTLGVQSQGVTSWVFSDADYLKTGRESGIYRIGTKEPLVIEPGQNEMHGLQITIIKSRVEGAVIVKGAVQFAQQGLQFISNNQITISL